MSLDDVPDVERELDPKTVEDRAGLVAFIGLLLATESPVEWENDRTDSYLEAMAAWLGSMDGVFKNRGEPTPEEPSWSLIAQMLLTATIYE